MKFARGRIADARAIEPVTYDILIARAALKARVDAILTWNLHDFAPFAPQIRVEAPG